MMNFSMLTGIVSSWIVTSTIPWQTGMLTATVLASIPLVVLFCLRKNIINVQRSGQSQGVGRIFRSAFGMLSVYANFCVLQIILSWLVFKIAFFYSKSYLFITAEASLSSLQRDAENFWFPSVYLLAFTNAPEIFFGLSYPT